MNYSGEAADQILRVSIQGAEVALRLSGRAAERVMALIYTLMKNQQQTSGKTRLAGMLKSGKEITVFSVPEKDLSDFAAEAKRYGVLYCVLKEKKKDETGITDVMVYKEDASKINRIVERLSLATVEVTADENPTITRMKSRGHSDHISRTKEIYGKVTSDTLRKQEKSIRKLIDEISYKRRSDVPGASRVRKEYLKESAREAGKAAQERTARARD